MTAKYRAPTANGAVLAEPHFDALPALVEANRERLDRTDVRLAGYTLKEFRELTKQEYLGEDELFRTVIVTGHQPELSHPGVWVKNFATVGLARKLGAIPLNLVVDNDTLKSTSLRFPSFHQSEPESAHLASVPFDTFAGEVPYEDRRILDSATFCEFLPRMREATRHWPYKPLLFDAWQYLDPAFDGSFGQQIAGTRARFEREWGCYGNDLAVSELCDKRPFRAFTTHLLNDLPRFRDAYNRAIRAYRDANGVRSANHPAPELEEGEAPFWARTGTGRRARATATSDPRSLRPRALTLTLFARVCLGDFFIHGIGGGKYDEVTDAIIRDYFGIPPPAYQVLSATLHLPLPAFASSRADELAAARRVRDLHWNPHKFLPAEHATERERLCAAEPPREAHAARREWFRALQKHTEALRPLVADQLPAAVSHLARVRAECEANAILQRRDFAWVLYPEDVLRAFLQRFLDE